MSMRLAVCLVALLAFGTRVSAREDRSLPKGWTPGPITANLADRATVEVPDGYYYLDAAATKRWLAQKHHLSDGRELGTILRVGESGEWFAVFTHSASGHVDDGEHGTLDAETLLAALGTENQRVNVERAKQGWSAMDVQAWHRPPAYSSATNRLTWSTRLVSGEGVAITYDVRLLGRDGFVSARLVTDPESVLLATSQFVEVMLTYRFNDGSAYADFRPGEQLADATLTTLIVNSAAMPAAESGYFPALGMGVLFVVIVLLIGAKVLLGRREAPPVIAEPAATDVEVDWTPEAVDTNPLLGER
jgi:uncharacterized membrane-anchored protein